MTQAAGSPRPQPFTVALAAGGTGGHLFPAQALAETLIGRGYAVHLFTDQRGMEYAGRFPAEALHHVPSATMSFGKPLEILSQALKLFAGYRRARALLKQIAPRVAVGFGGYPSLPPLIAAQHLGIPTALHEQNAVMGRANRIVARGANAIATSFSHLHNAAPALQKKVVLTGNPVRASVIAASDRPYRPPQANEPFNLLVFGGSQGARFFSEFVPDLLEQLPAAVRRTLTLVQQCRPEDMEAVKARTEALGVKALLAPFFADLPDRIASAHLVVARSGASTIAELGVIGRPAILVPLPHALESDQLRNAESFAAEGAGWVRPQASLKAPELAAFLTQLRYADRELAAAAAAAKRQGRPNAAERLADLVVSLGGPVDG
ncbi:MAG: undecaprenyldiphospho-muramoylpentapeptide beta-N-acetylglucosaminyltransferase [Hyphomicrobiales bacterium]